MTKISEAFHKYISLTIAFNYFSFRCHLFIATVCPFKVVAERISERTARRVVAKETFNSPLQKVLISHLPDSSSATEL